MRYTRVEIKNKFKKYRIIFCFTILIPIFALVLGKVLVNYSEKESTTIAVKLNDFKNVYLLQVGVYKNQEGGNQKIKSLNEKDVKPIILKDGEYYKVVTKVASTPKKLEEEKVNLDNKGISSYIKDFPIKGVEEMKDGNIKEYTTYVKEYILSSLEEKRSAMKSSYNSAIKCKILKGENGKLQEKINSLLKSNMENSSEKNDEIYLKNILEIIITYNKIT